MMRFDKVSVDHGGTWISVWTMNNRWVVDLCGIVVVCRRTFALQIEYSRVTMYDLSPREVRHDEVASMLTLIAGP